MKIKIILSPAKKMQVDTDSLPWQQLPVFLPQAAVLQNLLRSMTPQQLKHLWNCSDAILEQNLERLHRFELTEQLTPALLAYDGIQYKHMAAGVFSDSQFAYLQDSLCILSGFYGLLRPFDGVIPYRLEMQAKLAVGKAADLYAFWGDSIARQIFADGDCCLLDLASREYSRCVLRHLPKGARVLGFLFAERNPQGKLVEKGTLCKMARGEMVRFLAEHQVRTPEEATALLPQFTALGYRYSPADSDEGRYVFVRHSPCHQR